MADTSGLLWICAKGFQDKDDLKDYFAVMGTVETCVFPLPQYGSDQRGLVGLRSKKSVNEIQKQLKKNRTDAEILNEPFDTVEATVRPFHVANLTTRTLRRLAHECCLNEATGSSQDSCTVEGHYLLVEAFQHEVRKALRRAPGEASSSARTTPNTRQTGDRSSESDDSSQRSGSPNSDAGTHESAPSRSRGTTQQRNISGAGGVQSPTGASREVSSNNSGATQPSRQTQSSPGLSKSPSTQNHASPAQGGGSAGRGGSRGRPGASQGGGGRGARSGGQGQTSGGGRGSRSQEPSDITPAVQAAGRQYDTGHGRGAGSGGHGQTGTGGKSRGDSSSGRGTPAARPQASGASGGAGAHGGASGMHVFKGSGSGKLKLCIYATNILEIQVDAIVCPVTNKLVHGGGIAKSLMEEGGSEYETTVEKAKQELKGGILSDNKCKKIHIPGRCGLPFSEVILVNGPTRKEVGGDKKTRLKRSTENILLEAASLSSVAIPLIGSGATGMSARDAAKFMLEAMLKKGKDTAGLRQIHFVHPKADVVEKMLLAANMLNMEAWSSLSSKSAGKGRGK